MPNYQQGKIYKIVSNIDDDICYIGSTTRPLLCQRMEQHRISYRRWKNGKRGLTTSYEMFEKYGVENCSIELIEIVPCNSKDELNKKEGEHIRNLNCVNRCIAGRTNKEYYEANKDTIIDRHKEYYEANKDDITQHKRKWYEANKDKMLKRAKEYYEANRDKISQKGKEKYTCVCGLTIRKSDKNRHEKSLKHMNYCASVSVVP
jgi:hypothetical protein